jgi:hypothetical protein
MIASITFILTCFVVAILSLLVAGIAAIIMHIKELFEERSSEDYEG